MNKMCIPSGDCVHVAVRYGAEVFTSTVYVILRDLGHGHNRPRHLARIDGCSELKTLVTQGITMGSVKG